jgi:S-adenosyl-methyltransferase MraW
MDNLQFYHVPVLLSQCVEALHVRPDGIYIDGTAGGGGHSQAIASLLDAGRLIAIDKDPAAVAAATERLAPYPQAQVVQGDFADLGTILYQLDIPQVDGILLDLGVSSHQLDTAERGFSYHLDAPLDMRMTGNGRSARDVVNTYEITDLVRIFRRYGDEKYAVPIARKILAAREIQPIESTHELSELIKSSIPAAVRRTGGHPAKQVFQAIRIEVNGELEHLEQALEQGFEHLKPGGRFAVITFHSLEDRMVKQHFAAFCKGCECPPDFPICICGKSPRARLVHKKPQTAAPQELAENNRSRSAKLRTLEKLAQEERE